MPMKRTSMPNQRLRQERVQRGWTQRQVAEAVGTNLVMVSRWEGGVMRPGPRYRQQLCALFGKSAQELGFVSPVTPAAVRDAERTPPPPLWQVPFRRNPFFTGREEVLAQLHQRLSSGVPQAITGLGGIGKTQLVLEYAHRYRDAYQAVFWLRAESRELLLADLVALAEALHLAELVSREQPRLLRAVQHWLRTHPGWLLVLDNVEDLTLLADFFPDMTGGALLLTTQSASTGPLAQTLDLDALDSEEGALLLLRRAKRLGPMAPLQEATEDERREAAQVTALLGGLPLALDQAGAYLEETQCGLAEYRQLFQALPLPLLHHPDRWSGHPRSVVQTFTLAVERVAQRQPAAVDLLTLCAFLAPDHIPEELLTSGADVPGSTSAMFASDPLLFQQAHSDLRAYSLIRRHPETRTVSLHRLVQAVVRERLGPEAHVQWASRVVQLVNRVFPDAALPEHWPTCHLYLPHAEVCARWIQQEHLDTEEAGQLLLKSAEYLQELAQYPRAEALLQEAHALYQCRGALDHAEVVTLWYLQAKVAKDQRHYAQAEALCRQALQLGERVLGAADVRVVRPLTLLASVLANRGEHAEAERYYQQALQQYQRLSGPVQSDIAMILNDLAWSIRQQGRYAEAEELLVRSRALYEQLLGREHAQVAVVIDNLASIYVLAGRYAEAEPLLHEALNMRKRVLPADHPRLANTLHLLAQFCLTRGDYAQAAELQQQALAIHTKLFGEESGDVAIVLNDLAVATMERGYYAQAEPLYRRSLTIGEQVFGPHHLNVAVPWSNLAKLYLMQGRADEAEAISQKALALVEHAFGRRHPRIALILTTLGGIALEHGRAHEAEGYFQEAIQIQEQVLGKDHLRLAPCCVGLATLYVQRGTWVQAEALYQRALGIWETVSSDHPDAAAALQGLADLALEQQQYQEAESLYTRTLHLREHRLGAQHPLTAETVQRLASLQRAQGNERTARSLYQRALTIREQTFGPTHPRTMETRRCLEELRKHRQAPPVPGQRGPTAQEQTTTAAARQDVSAAAGTPPMESSATELSQREQEILALLVAGRSNREIAEVLVMEVSTVKWYLKRLYSKLQVHSRTQAIAQANTWRQPTSDEKASVRRSTS